MRIRIRYSQNFIQNQQLANRLVSNATLDPNIPVIEIGPGAGIITQALLKKGYFVLAYEIDPHLVVKLRHRLSHPHLTLLNQDFQQCHLPSSTPYQVFSNIPFAITASIVKKLLFAQNPPQIAYLIMQHEAALKYIAPNQPNLISTLLAPDWLISIQHHFQPTNFFPRPNVEIVLLRAQLRKVSFLNHTNRSRYYDFITYAYNQPPPLKNKLLPLFTKNNKEHSLAFRILSHKLRPTQLSPSDWQQLFSAYASNQLNTPKAISGAYTRLLATQNKLTKIHRTRKDRNWRYFNNPPPPSPSPSDQV